MARASRRGRADDGMINRLTASARGAWSALTRTSSANGKSKAARGRGRARGSKGRVKRARWSPR